MFGNKNAGLAEVLTRFGRHTAKPEAVASEPFRGIPPRGLDAVALRETYFALQGPVRWLR